MITSKKQLNSYTPLSDEIPNFPSLTVPIWLTTTGRNCVYEGSVASRTVLLGALRYGATLWENMPAIFVTFSPRQYRLQITGM